MFGHQDNLAGQSDPATTTDNAAAATDQVHGDPLSPTLGSDSSATEPWQHPGKALDASTDQKNDVISPAGGFPEPLSSKEPIPGAPAPVISIPNHSSSTPSDNQLTDATDEDLIHVKKEALDELFPLIDKLDQSPEERFKTLMMIIQASDNHTLIEKAYQVAQTIDDEKVRAQALLDIVNEINYFTQQPEV